MEQLLAIAAKIETPLSLAALAALILYLLFNKIIERLDLEKVLKAHVYRLLMRAMTFTFVLAIVALVLGLLSYLATNFMADFLRSRRTDVFLRELSDISLITRIAAINGLAEIASHDRVDDRRICDSLASLVRRASESTLKVKLKEIDDDVAVSMVTISDLNKSRICKESDLQGSDLRRLELPNGSLVGAKLVGARLDDANLAGVNLTGADLTGANLTAAVLRGSSLREAKLGEANLYNTILDNADMTSAEGLRTAELFASSLEGAILDKVDLRDAKLPLRGMRGASLRESNLARMDLSGLRGVCKDALARANTDGTRLPAYDC